MLSAFAGTNDVRAWPGSATAGRITALNKMATSFVSPLPPTWPEVSNPQEQREQELCPRPRGEGLRARYTVDGSDALEDQLHRSCKLVRDAALQRLPAGSIEGLLLGGGYGRGEGGVLQTRD